MSEERGEMFFIGACRHCGQISAEQPREMDSQEEADNWVTMHCKCTQATLERNLRERIEDAKAPGARPVGAGLRAVLL